MAMTFTIASAARDFLADVVSTRIRLEKEADDARAAAYEEAERERTRGTQVTPARFEEWRAKFLKELASKREKDEEERVRAMPPKERDDYKRKRDRLSGMSIFPVLGAGEGGCEGVPSQREVGRVRSGNRHVRCSE